MSGLSDLISKFRNVDSIPDVELQKIGWERKNGRVINIQSESRLDRDRRPWALDDSQDDRENVYDRIKTSLTNQATVQYNSCKVPKKYAKKIIALAVDNALKDNSNLISSIEAGYVNPEQISITEPEFLDAEKEVLKEEGKRIRDLVHTKSIPEDLIKEFETNYGPINSIGGGPFVSYALRRTVFGEKNPREFWGKKIFEYRKRFLEQFKGVQDIEGFAEYIYGSEMEHHGGRIFSGNSESIDSLDALLDKLPDGLSSFEERRKNQGAAVACLDTESFFIDDNWLQENEHLRDWLTAVQEREFAGELKEKRKGYAFLEDVVRSEGKKVKLMRLAAHDKRFLNYIKALAEGKTNYLDTLPENMKTTEELLSLGVNTSIFYNGIPGRKVIIENGESISPDKIKQENLHIYRVSLETLFGEQAIHGKDRLQQKIIDTLKVDGREIPQDVPKYLLELEQEKDVTTVCKVAAEYSSKKTNIKDSQKAGAALHHLKDVGKFFAGKQVESEENGRTSYFIKMARKNPFTDVDIGNDGGCCIGVYSSNEEFMRGRDWTVDTFRDHLEGMRNFQEVSPNGCYIPFYLMDKATHFTEIYRGEERSGMALMFAGKNERNEPVLAINSIEFPNKLRNQNREAIATETLRFIKDYATQAGFKHVIMGGHSYNAAKSTNEKPIDFESFSKINHMGNDFYSDIGTEDASTSGFSLI